MNETDIDAVANAALAAYEREHGELTDTERLAFQVGFADGAGYALKLSKAIVDTTFLIEKARLG